MGTAGDSSFNLGHRLTLTFATLIVLILGGNALVVSQFQMIHNEAGRLTGANQQLVAVLRLQANLLSYHRRLDDLARSMDVRRLVTEAESLRGTLREQIQQTRTAIAKLPSETVVDPSFLPTLEIIDVTLPAQIEAIVELAKSSDWAGIQPRVDNELNPIETQTAILVNSINQEASRELERGVAEIKSIQRRILVIVPATALSTFFIAALFGWSTARRFIEDHKRAEQLLADLAHLNRVSTMGEMTASLAHEIKQPIGAAVTNAEACARLLGRDQPDVLEAREAALEMAKDARRAAHIIDRVRSLYRKGSSQMDAVDVNEVIGEMLLLLHNEANRHSVNIRTDVAEGLPKVKADRVQLQQVLMNLMFNGIQAMEKTGGALTIKSQLDQEGRVLISVSDTGVGLPTDKADEIFNAFFTTKPEGSGMGLAISRSIVESHGGRLWATANSGRGATFHFSLPTAPQVVQERATGT